MTQSQPPITGTTHTLPFDKLSPRDFERLLGDKEQVAMDIRQERLFE